MSRTTHETLLYLAEKRVDLRRQYEEAYDQYIYARRVKLPVLARLMGREMQSCQAAIVCHEGLLRAYRKEVKL